MRIDHLAARGGCDRPDARGIGHREQEQRIAVRIARGRGDAGSPCSAGLYRPRGEGDIDFAAVAAALGKYGYRGWWVLEQDAILESEPVGEGPVADVRTSAEHLRSL